MAEFQINITLRDELLPLIEAMRGKHQVADFLRGAMQLGLSELLGDAARRISDRQVADLQEVQHMDEEPIVWQQLQTFLSVAPPALPSPAPVPDGAAAGSAEDPD